MTWALLLALAADPACDLHGRVRVVDRGPADYVVRFVPTGPADMSVQWVTTTPRSPGEWQEVDAFADFTVRRAGPSDFAHFTARVVDWDPGC